MKSSLSIPRLILVVACLLSANNISARPIEMVEPIWCLSEVQKNELMGKFKPIIKQAEIVDIYLSMLTFRKALYLASERELIIAQDGLDACQKKALPNCDQTGVRRFERDIKEADELEAKPLSESNGAKMSAIVEKMRAVRSEFPSCK